MQVQAYAAFRDLMNSPTLGTDLASPTSVFSNPAVTGLMSELRTTITQENEREMLAPMVEIIAKAADPLRACQAALLSGTMVEFGAQAAQFLPTLTNLLTRIGKAAAGQLLHPTQLEADLDARRAAKGVGLLLFAIMTQSARASTERMAARQQPLFLESLEALTLADQQGQLQALWYVNKLYKAYDGDMRILFPETKRGLHVRLAGVQNNFHLFSLLQAKLPDLTAFLGLPARPAGNAALHDFIMGNPFDESGLPVADAAQHTYGDFGLWENAKRGETSMQGFLAGDALCWTIPEIDGMPLLVVGLKPTFGSRSWDLAMFPPLHDALRTEWEVLKVIGGDEFSRLEQCVLQEL